MNQSQSQRLSNRSAALLTNLTLANISTTKTTFSIFQFNEVNGTIRKL
jgi:hypothetical protein